MSRRYRRRRYNRHDGEGHDNSLLRRKRRMHRRSRGGWGMNLYRNTRQRWIGGVCAGIADYWDVEHWVVRLLAVILFLFTGSLAFWAYVAGWVMLSPRRRRDADSDREERLAESDNLDMEYDERVHDYRPRKMFRYSDSPGVRLQRARERLDGALHRVEDMERYVTSRQYDLNKEFSRL